MARAVVVGLALVPVGLVLGAAGPTGATGLVGLGELAGPGGPGGPGTAGAATLPPAPANWGAAVGPRCDGLDTALCMLPFPNDYYTVPEPSMPTGRRVDIPAGAFPATSSGAAFDPGPWEGNDGFSPGSTILTRIPGLGLRRTGMATISDMGASLRRGSPLVLLDATTGVRWPAWAELDLRDPNPATRLLVVHPARNLTEGDRYIVGLRNLRQADGAPIAPGLAFASVLRTRDARGVRGPGAPNTGTSGVPPAYRAHLEQVLATLRRHGVSRRGLYLAWDFTVASTRNLTAPALTMRDKAFAALGNDAPSFHVTHVVEDPPGHPAVAREVSGTFAVPNFLSATPGDASAVLRVGRNGLPVYRPGATDMANFVCEIPRAATTAHPAHVGIYGHGLFNSAGEVLASGVPQFSNAYDYVFCGTDWLGLSASTLPVAASVATNFSNFPSLADNLLQSLLNAQFLGRLLTSARGLVTAPAFQGAGGAPLLARSSGLVYYGNSEGGIMGGAFTALSTAVRRSVLGVPGMDYAVLLPRSADFAPYLGPLTASYPNGAVRTLGEDLIQMLWDRAEADGYAEQMTRPLPGTPPHDVLLEEAFGDHQVANVATETEARTIGATLREPALRPDRSNERQPFWDLPAWHPGMAGPTLTVWDAGVPPSPLADVPPTRGNDPHDTTPRMLPAFWAQMHTFLTTGRVSNPCGSRACRAPYPPPS